MKLVDIWRAIRERKGTKDHGPLYFSTTAYNIGQELWPIKLVSDTSLGNCPCDKCVFFRYSGWVVNEEPYAILDIGIKDNTVFYKVGNEKDSGRSIPEDAIGDIWFTTLEEATTTAKRLTSKLKEVQTDCFGGSTK